MASTVAFQCRVVPCGGLIALPNRISSPSRHSLSSGPALSPVSLKALPSHRAASTSARRVHVRASADPLTDSSASNAVAKASSKRRSDASPAGDLAGVPAAIAAAFSAAIKPALAALLISAVLTGASPDAALAAQGGGRMGGSGFSASRSYSPPASRSYGYSGGAPPVVMAPSVPFFAPSPFFFFGPTVSFGFPGSGLFNFLFLGMAIFFIANTVMGFLGSSAEERMWEDTQKSSVVRLQVGLLGSARKLQRDLDRLADRADASTPEGLHYILQETVLALLRNPDYCIYGFSSSDVANDSYAGEAAFNRLSMEERSKFKEETLVNVDGVRRRVTREASSERFSSEYIVVTVIAASEGTVRLPDVKTAADLREALTILGSVPTDELQAVEVMWTPQNNEDTLSERDMLTDYPRLRAL
eukprot:TRINITY_DN18355_c0_g1_i1.p1 TRINITY_DN18355_c0_g1~~TRINITY_DN18355_c0_g1_i1.p1  ORF type:complete len:416 (+),score=-7.80 TRINITY_DN18355_c0_g1_i1:67-1314(+)